MKLLVGSFLKEITRKVSAVSFETEIYTTKQSGDRGRYDLSLRNDKVGLIIEMK